MKKILIVSFFMALNLCVYAQNTFKAVIKDSEKKELLMGVTAQVTGTTIATTSDENGQIILTGIPNGLQVIHGPFLHVRDNDALREYSKRTRTLGYDGKWALHPDQVDVLNDVFSPTQEQFDKAWQILDAYNQATETDGKGAVMFGLEMIDEASRKMALKFITRGELAGRTRTPQA